MSRFKRIIDNSPRVLNHYVKKADGRTKETVVFIHGIGNSLESWTSTIDFLPKDYKIIAIDLLGFGKSPRPKYAEYDISLQARSVMLTLVSLGIASKVILIGHSMGSLVSIELAKRYPFMFKGLVLCSPPLYSRQSLENSNITTEKALVALYKSVGVKTPDVTPTALIKLGFIATKVGITSSAFNLSAENAPAFLKSLKKVIIDQSAYEDIQNLKRPVKILSLIHI